jgi:hypothetical protein
VLGLPRSPVHETQMSRRSDNDLIGVLSVDRLWIVTHDGMDSANGLRRALQKAAELESTSHNVTSVRDPNDRTVIEPDQIGRLLKRLGLP